MKLYLFTLILQLALCLLIIVLPDNLALFTVWIFLVYVCEAAHFVIFPAFCSSLYGSSLGSTLYSAMYFARAVAAGVGIIASSFIQPRYGWPGCFVFFAINTVIAMGVVVAWHCRQRG